jgi:sulfate transport system substrate-binding protein
MKNRLMFVFLVLLQCVALAGCGTPATGSAATGTTAATADATSATSAPAAGSNASSSGGATKITLGAYTTPREAYAKIIPMFKESWKKQTGQDVTFQESYQGSGAQSRAIVEGFDADVAALALEADINRIKKAGLITHDWKAGPHNGMVSTSIVAFAVRPGNPKGIKDWADLAKPGIEVLTPNPKTSGGAQWNIMGLYGAALRGNVAGVAKGDETAAQNYLKQVLKNVSVMDKGARESITNFEKGVGDVAITYENEVLVGQHKGEKLELVIPKSSILIENPIALVDSYVDKHGNRKAVEAFIQFLFTPEAQKVFAETGGLRSVDENVAKETAKSYPAVADLFTIKEFGGWSEVTPKFFGDSGIYSVVSAQVQK